MGKRGRGYGSEDNLLRYREHRPTALDNALMEKLGKPNGVIEWVYPAGECQAGVSSEPEGLGFVQDKNVLTLWSDFWPQKGKQPTWDGVARFRHESGTEWVLIEAKANRPEFCSPPCGATAGRKKIAEAMSKAKGFLKVHHRFPWLGTYYQYANRLACLYFLTQVAQTPTRLVFLYFYGDRFKNGTPCPRSEAEWQSIIHACHLTLGLPARHALSDFAADIFLPAFAEEKWG
jgi:hypothetical protein